MTVRRAFVFDQDDYAVQTRPDINHGDFYRIGGAFSGETCKARRVLICCPKRLGHPALTGVAAV